MTSVKTVGVIGAGIMGSGIAQVVAQAGYAVVVREAEQRFVDKARQAIDGRLQRAVEKGRMTVEEKVTLLDRIMWTITLEELRGADLIIEAISEDLPLKQDLFRTLDRLCPPSTIFVSNTSSISIMALASVTGRADRFAGLHFFNPVPLMKLVEVVRSIRTSAETFRTVSDFATSLGKEPVAAKDHCGFIVNRLLVPYLLDGIRALEAGVASAADIDKAMRLGCNHPMGPLELADFVGLDTTYAIANIMFEEYREARYAPPPLLKTMVIAGYHGRKSGRGFYDYSGSTPHATDLGL
ncbi:3-hydroxybutyryl-CoA dehydrogenase [Candidatus Methylomirabilis sp.]|uniref:3-hydroxyacyl-CoA dehydrogenase family protein n=1 Tax=Candidatus Methylomirabilis sp. TaxID=2032687 RepID=UPI002A6537B5|nr:3-hydroxybutyryl-CoA dehydrogenase [Candidatus Methylomirabilis sp.]